MLIRLVSASRSIPSIWRAAPRFSVASRTFASHNDEQEMMMSWIPPFVEKSDEPTEIKRNRLMYQSRKRGMLENGLLLGSFASRYLSAMTSDQLSQYDRLINLPSNDWEIYYWVTGAKETPQEFDNDVMNLLKHHAKNTEREQRINLPDLN